MKNEIIKQIDLQSKFNNITVDTLDKVVGALDQIQSDLSNLASMVNKLESMNDSISSDISDLASTVNSLENNLS